MSFIVSFGEEQEQDEVVRSISKNQYIFRIFDVNFLLRAVWKSDLFNFI